LLLLASAEYSFACTCVASNRPLNAQVKEAFNNSNVIFSGEVTSITPKSEYEVTVKIKVEKSWKGTFSKEVAITTNKNSAMCGYGFEVGKTYLVYAYGAKDDLSTTNCSRTKLFSNKEDIKYLDKLKKRVKIKST
jgi:hypothetical protein